MILVPPANSAGASEPRAYRVETASSRSERHGLAAKAERRTDEISSLSMDRFVMFGANTYGGTVVVSSSGGLLSRGNPSGATGLAQICELT
jgi:acetyl-CoA acetyltransferase